MKMYAFVFLAFVGPVACDKGFGGGLSGSYGAPAEGHLIIENLAAGHAGGGGGLNCYPQTHYQTHYQTQIKHVPVYKTVVSSQLIEHPVSSVIYETIYKKNTAFVTETEYITEVDTITNVNYNPITSTVNRVLFRPIFVTETVFETQNQPLEFTATEIVTEFRQLPIEHTRYTTDIVTVTDPVTLTHKSEVINERFFTTTHTEVVNKQIVVTETFVLPAPIIQEEVLVLNTKQIVSIKPSYLVSTVFQTHFVTTTNIERVPVYVTQTAYDHCKPAIGYSIPELDVSLGIGLSGANAIAGAGGRYSYSKPALGFDIRQSGAAAKAASSGPIILSASGGPVNLGAALGSKGLGGY
ncbi:uncharacterized protein [Palaemon carinicauda]|uniref:uncharacterized protein n=1 Tax=Palaemon carinicauda TaxID=392227 RepID=UPI0035B6A649